MFFPDHLRHTQLWDFMDPSKKVPPTITTLRWWYHYFSWMVYFMENPMNKWMIWGVFPYFWKHPYLGGGSSNIFYFHPENWGRWTHFDEHIFSNGLVQPPTRTIRGDEHLFIIRWPSWERKHLEYCGILLKSFRTVLFPTTPDADLLSLSSEGIRTNMFWIQFCEIQ